MILIEASYYTLRIRYPYLALKSRDFQITTLRNQIFSLLHGKKFWFLRDKFYAILSIRYNKMSNCDQ